MTFASVETAPEPAAQVAGLRKRFGYREALRGIDLEVPRTGSFVVFGPNGAGKSTLLRIIATRMRPSAGTLRVLGLDPGGDGPRLRALVGAVFHEHFLRADLTLEENLRYFADLHGLPRSLARDRGEGLTSRFGLWLRRHDRVRTYSQGMQKRATLIRSLLHAPRLWVLDEPFSGLDPAGAALLEEVIAEKRRESAVLLVTHDVEAGLRLAEGCIALEGGRLRACGREAVEEYLASQTAPGRGAAAGGGA